MERLSETDCYETPEDKKIYFREKILPGNTRGFYWDYLRRIKGASKLSKKGLFPYPVYKDVSWSIFQDIEGHGGKFKIDGLDYLRHQKKPLVIVANHMSVLETQIMAPLIYPLEMSFVVKQSLMEHFLFGPIMTAISSIPVGRKNPIEDMKKVLEVGTRYLGEGRCITIFPEGTRNADFEPRRFNSMGVKLAINAGVDVIPLALKTDFWGQGKKVKDFGKISRNKEILFSFGEPMTPVGRGKEQHQECVRFITDKLRGWGTRIIGE